MTKKELINLSNEELDKTVKIQGTKFDRKRKLSSSDLEKISYLYQCGKNINVIAAELGVAWRTVKYHLDETFRYKENHRGGSHAQGKMDFADRVAYKRKLVASGAKVIYPM